MYMIDDVQDTFVYLSYLREKIVHTNLLKFEMR